MLCCKPLEDERQYICSLQTIDITSPHPSCYYPYFTFRRENRSHQMRTLSTSHLQPHKHHTPPPACTPTFSSSLPVMLEEVFVFLSKCVPSQGLYPFSSGFLKDGIPLDFRLPASSISPSTIGHPINAQTCLSIFLPKRKQQPLLCSLCSC